MTEPSSYSFGRWLLCPSERTLMLDGQPVKVGARAFDVLHELIQRRDRVVTKGELLDRVWDGLVVEEGNLATQVSTLRKLLGSDVISTVPGRGYRTAASLSFFIARTLTLVAAGLAANSRCSLVNAERITRGIARVAGRGFRAPNRRHRRHSPG